MPRIRAAISIGQPPLALILEEPGRDWTRWDYRLVKGFTIFEWQNANWKRDNKPDNTESTFGIHAYNGTLCQSKTGAFGMWNAKENYWASFHDDVSYNVDKLAPLTSAAHPEGLLTALSKYFR